MLRVLNQFYQTFLRTFEREYHAQLYCDPHPVVQFP
jgi:uncharacterized membrane protein